MRQRFRSWAALPALGLTFGLVATACSSDSSDSNNGGSDGGGGSIYTRFGIEDPKDDEFIFANVKSPYDDAAGCKAFPSKVKDSHDCTCDKCFDIQQQCDALPGCIEIAECGIKIGCTDAYTCYLTPTDSSCVPIIDKWGNTGSAAALSLALAGCAADPANGCR